MTPPTSPAPRKPGPRRRRADRRRALETDDWTDLYPTSRGRRRSDDPPMLLILGSMFAAVGLGVLVALVLVYLSDILAFIRNAFLAR